MSEQTKVNKTRRNLVVATSVVGGAAGVGAAVPFVASMLPSERAKAAGAPVEVDISQASRPGEMAVIEWRGKPVWVIRRTKEMLESLKAVTPRLTDPASKASKQPKYAKNEFRSAKPECDGDGRRLHAPRLLAAAEDRPRPRPRWAATGRAASTARATARSSTMPAACSAARRRRPTSRCRRTRFVSDSTLLIGEDQEKKGA